MTPWQALGVSPNVAVADLRRRYAALIKEFRPETHPQDFARIREAYEVALPFARQREAEAAEAALAGEPDVVVAEAHDDASQAAQAPSAPPVDEAIAEPGELITVLPVADAAPEQEQVSRLAAHFRGFQEIAGSATGTHDEAWLPALRVLLQARAQATLDDSQALEFALMRWFVESDSPPLTLLFETGRAFDWHRHPARLSNWLSPWALRQMEARLALSRDLVHARHFSGNLRLRRLHATRAGPALLVMRPGAVETRFWIGRWRRACEDADTTPLAACLNGVAIRQLRGLASTDVLAGLAVAAFAPDLAGAFAWAVLATAIVFGLRRALLAIVELPQGNRLRRAAHAIESHRIVAGVVVFVCAWLAAMMLKSPDPGAGMLATAGLLVAPLALMLAACVWRFAAFLESVVAWHFQWREAVDRLELDAFLRSNAMPAASQPFGPRLAFVQRLKSIRAALRLQAVEVAMRERPPRVQPFNQWRLGRLRLKGQNRWRLVWFSAWILLAILRAVHAFGGTH